MNLFRIREKETTTKRIELESAGFEKVSCIPGWQQTHYILKNNLELQIFLPLKPPSTRVKHTFSQLQTTQPHCNHILLGFQSKLLNTFKEKCGGEKN